MSKKKNADSFSDLLGDCSKKRKFIITYEPENINIPNYQGHKSVKERILSIILSIDKYKGITIKEIDASNQCETTGG